MQDTFLLSVVLIILCAMIGAFIKAKTKDACLNDFKGNYVNIKLKQQKTVWGNMNVEPTGIELIYNSVYNDKKYSHPEKTYILYKNEFSQIAHIIRYIDQLKSDEYAKREKLIKKYKSKNITRNLKRKIRNTFSTMRDGFLDAISLVMGRVKTAVTPMSMIAGQEKYISQLKGQVIPMVSTQFEPLLEKHIGSYVILKVIYNENDIVEYKGLLKDYTTDFIEVLDISIDGKRADIITPRQHSIVRHLSE